MNWKLSQPLIRQLTSYPLTVDHWQSIFFMIIWDLRLFINLLYQSFSHTIIDYYYSIYNIEGWFFQIYIYIYINIEGWSLDKL